MKTFQLSGNIVDIPNRKIFPGRVTVSGSNIEAIEPTPGQIYHQYLLPGFIDSHVHIESSMLAPSEFARMAVVHGTVATVSDPHEIANVLGLEGVRFMIRNSKTVPFHFFFGAPSCVPATSFETAGAELTPDDIRVLLEQDNLKYLSEMMNFPGVLHAQPDVMQKIAIAKELKRPIDGHSPGLMGDDAKRYIEAGISTDHECFTLPEALNKLSYGMKILIREGSAAKNFEALHSLVSSHPLQVMFCSDDKHPDELVKSHIDALVRRSVVDKGHHVFDVLQAACWNPVDHYGLEVGRLRPGDSADFIVVEDLHQFNILQTYIGGHLVAEKGKSLIPRIPVEVINHFKTSPKKAADFAVKGEGDHMRVIEVLDGQLITQELIFPTKKDSAGNVMTDVAHDILKLVVVNRYSDAPPAVGFVKNFGLRKGALASSIAHDSHNIIAVGCTDKDLCEAINSVIKVKGGIAAVADGEVSLLPLPLAGLMSPDDGWVIADHYSTVNARARELGSTLQAPFMSLSFLALLVIPALKLGDKGLFDVNRFAFTNLTTSGK